MSKIELETEDGQKMIVEFDSPDVKMTFPDSNTRTVDIGKDKLLLKSIFTDKTEVKIPA